MKHIVSERQAERVGQALTGGQRGEHFIVFRYPHRPSNLTLFAVEIKHSGEIVSLA